MEPVVGMSDLGVSVNSQNARITLANASPFDLDYENLSPVITVGFGYHHLFTAHDGGRFREHHCPPNMVALHPKGQHIRARTGSVSSEFLHLAIRDNWIQDSFAAAEWSPPDLTDHPFAVLEDVGHLARMARANILSTRRDEMLLESLAVALFRLSLIHFKKVPEKASAPSLTKLQLSRLNEYIEMHLSERLSVDKLAQMAGMSSFHFVREFKTCCGMTPHQYVIERRLTRAREALQNTSATIASIAQDVGFSSQAHLTDVFRKRLGVTPRVYRSQSVN